MWNRTIAERNRAVAAEQVATAIEASAGELVRDFLEGVLLTMSKQAGRRRFRRPRVRVFRRTSSRLKAPR